MEIQAYSSIVKARGASAGEKDRPGQKSVNTQTAEAASAAVFAKIAKSVRDADEAGLSTLTVEARQAAERADRAAYVAALKEKVKSGGYRPSLREAALNLLLSDGDGLL